MYDYVVHKRKYLWPKFTAHHIFTDTDKAKALLVRCRVPDPNPDRVDPGFIFKSRGSDPIFLDDRIQIRVNHTKDISEYIYKSNQNEMK